MKKVDWNNPPEKIRITLRIPTNDVLGFYDESEGDLPLRTIKEKSSLLEVFASGSDEIYLELGIDEPHVSYKKVKDKSCYERKSGVAEASKHLVYELIE